MEGVAAVSQLNFGTTVTVVLTGAQMVVLAVVVMAPLLVYLASTTPADPARQVRATKVVMQPVWPRVVVVVVLVERANPRRRAAPVVSVFRVPLLEFPLNTPLAARPELASPPGLLAARRVLAAAAQEMGATMGPMAELA